MNANKQTFLIAVYIAVASALLVEDVAAQGALNPTGAPTSTMKTLEQLEPRVDVMTLAADATHQHVISRPGSYYLSTNLVVTGTSGILIDSTDVTLDLKGFIITRASGSNGYGIEISSAMDGTVVCNGRVSHFDIGIYCKGAPVANKTKFRNLMVSECGLYGMYVGASSQIIDCQAYSNPGVGIYASHGCLLTGCIARNNTGSYGICADTGSILRNCSAYNNSSYGICTTSGATLENCSSYGNSPGIYTGDSSVLRGCAASYSISYGIHAGIGSTMTDCTATHNNGDGITAYSESSVKNCTAEANAGNGIHVYNNSYIAGNTCIQNGYLLADGAGIYVHGTGNRIENNHVTGGNDRGIELDDTDNWVSGNTVMGNTDNYVFVQGNQLDLLLSEVPETIDWPASVKFAGTLVQGSATSHAIDVNSSDVKINLDGHALAGPATTIYSGIYLSAGCDRITVCNGSIRSFKYGINSVDSEGCLFEKLVVSECFSGGSAIYAAASSRLIDCQVLNNAGNGLSTGNGSLFSGCIAKNNSGKGIETGSDCQIRSSMAIDNGSHGIYADLRSSVYESCATGNNGVYGIRVGDNSSVLQCSAADNSGTGSANYGICAGKRCSVIECTATGNSNINSPSTSLQGIGIYASESSNVERCIASDNTGDGIRVTIACKVKDNVCDKNGTGTTRDGAGIHVINYDSVIDGNRVYGCDRGIDVDDHYNLIIRNMARSNGTNYVINSFNRVGFIVEGPWSGPISGKTGANGVGSTDPWANFSY